jgi:hypothetical protein
MYWSGGVATEPVGERGRPFTPTVVRSWLNPGSMPSWFMFESDSRTFASSPPVASETLVLAVRPVSKKSRTLFGCATNGAGSSPYNGWTIISPASSRGPQLSSVVAWKFPREPWPYRFWYSGSRSGVLERHVRARAVIPMP